MRKCTLVIRMRFGRFTEFLYSHYILRFSKCQCLRKYGFLQLKMAPDKLSSCSMPMRRRLFQSTMEDNGVAVQIVKVNDQGSEHSYELDENALR